LIFSIGDEFSDYPELRMIKAIPTAQNSKLFGWLRTLFPICSHLSNERIYISTQMAAVELMLSGCNTARDHHYLFSNDFTPDLQIQAAQEIGIRFHASRGRSSKGISQGGLTLLLPRSHC
jgi:8-oxoguanine deaminase